ncbi:hypothetical protein Taro_051171 [Colocasia esculenta]|uniref:MI domain-containing protein n=1 Tax=Colocasia esculenta TaxID=4460 RepID=A0A843XFU6_COLES|nr:hypothetical protein [Colocasia esculenta]
MVFSSSPLAFLHISPSPDIIPWLAPLHLGFCWGLLILLGGEQLKMRGYLRIEAPRNKSHRLTISEQGETNIFTSKTVIKTWSVGRPILNTTTKSARFPVKKYKAFRLPKSADAVSKEATVQAPTATATDELEVKSAEAELAPATAVAPASGTGIAKVVQKPAQLGNLPAGLRVVCKHIGKSRSASAAIAAVPSPPPTLARRWDDSLLQQQDGIQSAIAHCKMSFNFLKGGDICKKLKKISFACLCRLPPNPLSRPPSLSTVQPPRQRRPGEPQLASVVQSQPQCLCQVLNGGSALRLRHHRQSHPGPLSPACPTSRRHPPPSATVPSPFVLPWRVYPPGCTLPAIAAAGAAVGAARDKDNRLGGETMSDVPVEKSRKERRKEARQNKKQKQLQAWLQHQTAKKKKNVEFEPSSSPGLSKINKPNKEPDSPSNLKSMVNEEMKANDKAPETKMAKERNKSARKKKTKFEEFVEMEMNKERISDEFDLEMEKKLAKKLRVKRGKLGGFDDGLDMLLEGIPSAIDLVMDDKATDHMDTLEEGHKHLLSSKKRKRKKTSNIMEKNADDGAQLDAPTEGSLKTSDAPSQQVVAAEECLSKRHAGGGPGKYVAPHLRSHSSNESEEVSQMRRRVRGLLNRLSESNVESITQEIAAIYQSMDRNTACQVVSAEILSSCSRGPRGNEQYAAVFAAFVAGMACLVGIDFSARLIASLAKSFEDEYVEEDNLSLRNLTLLLSYLYIFGVCASDLMYDFLCILSNRLTELDVSTILTILQCSGMKLRGDDPTAMKEFIFGIQSRVNEFKSLPSNTQDGQQKINNKRMEFMLEMICNIKNNKTKSKEDPAPHTRIKKWLQKLRADDILLRSLKWGKLLDPEKKGQWWLSGEIAATVDDVKQVASTIDRQVPEAQKLLQLAATQRMNTDVRRAIFCIIMSGEDYVDAFEKILRLDLSGKQDREIMRVLVECCLQEKVFNKYYTVLASKLCSHDKNHKFTLQYCLWDHYKELNSMELNRSMNLARFTSEMFTSFSLSLAILKSVDLADPQHLMPRSIMHFRLLFETIFRNSDAVVWNMFTRIAGIPELEVLRNNLEFFIKQHVITGSSVESVPAKFELAKEALRNVSGVLIMGTQ